MSRNIAIALPLISALIVLGDAGTSVSAQTAPSPGARQQAGVRDILNRAETESRRRSVGEILGGIAGISQAAAQTAPPSAPQTPTQTGSARARAGQPASVAPRAGQPPPSSRARPSTVVQATGPATPATRTQIQAPAARSGRGTPSDPSMIATAPPAGPGDAAPGSQDELAAGGVAAPPAPDASSAPRQVVAGEDIPRHATAADGGHHRETRFRQVRAYRYGPAWCPPHRW